MPSLRVTYWLAGLVLLGLGYLYFFEQHMETSQEKRRTASRVLAMQSNSVVRLKLRRDAWTQASVERVSPETFRQTEPVTAAADGPSISKILSTLEFLEHRAVLEDAAADVNRRHEYGLDPPMLEVSVETEEGGEQTLFLGGDAPLGAGVYARANSGDSVLVVDKSVREMLSRELERLAGEQDDGSRGEDRGE